MIWLQTFVEESAQNTRCVSSHGDVVVEKTDKHKTHRHLEHSIENFKKEDRVKAQRELQRESSDLQHVTHHHRDNQRPERLEAVSQKADANVLIMRKERRNLHLEHRSPGDNLRDGILSQVGQLGSLGSAAGKQTPIQ